MLLGAAFGDVTGDYIEDGVAVLPKAGAVEALKLASRIRAEEAALLKGIEQEGSFSGASKALSKPKPRRQSANKPGR